MSCFCQRGNFFFEHVLINYSNPSETRDTSLQGVQNVNIRSNIFLSCPYTYITYTKCSILNLLYIDIHICISGFYPSTFVYSCFPQRLSFLTICLVQWLHGVAPWQTLKGKFLKCRSADCWKLNFSLIFLEILEFYGEF